MMPVEQARLFALVTETLAEYVKTPTAAELEAWWSSCRNLELREVERALKSHAADEDDGKRAPRPVDVKRRVSYGAHGGGGCAVNGCRFPGVFSDGTSGDGPWYCPWHREERGGSEGARWTEISQRADPEEAFRKRIERLHADGCRSLSVVNTAHAIALVHGNRPWREGGEGFAAELRARFGKPVPAGAVPDPEDVWDR